MRRYRLRPPGERAHRAVACAHPGRSAPRHHPRPGCGSSTRSSKALRRTRRPRATAPAEPPGHRRRRPGPAPDRAGLSADALRALVGGGSTTTANALPTVAKSTVRSSRPSRARAGRIPRPIIGEYGTDYQYRAGVALLGLGANTRDRVDVPDGADRPRGQSSTGGPRPPDRSRPAGCRPPAPSGR